MCSQRKPPSLVLLRLLIWGVGPQRVIQDHQVAGGRVERLIVKISPMCSDEARKTCIPSHWDPYPAPHQERELILSAKSTLFSQNMNKSIVLKNVLQAKSSIRRENLRHGTSSVSLCAVCGTISQTFNLCFPGTVCALHMKIICISSRKKGYTKILMILK